MKKNKEKLYIIGHKNPDTDSICSAIAYAEFKKNMGYDAIAIRAGEINKETEYVLNYFNVEPPKYVTTMRTRVSDLILDEATTINKELSIKNAWLLMKENTLKFLPVVDKNKKIEGILTLTDIANKYMEPFDNEMIKTSKTKLQNIYETLNAMIIVGEEKDFNTTGRVFIAVLSSNKLEQEVKKGDIVILGNRVECQRKCIELGANCIIITGGIENVSEDIVNYAIEKKAIILATDYDTFSTARLINQSIPVEYIMTKKNLVNFNTSEFIDEVQEKMQKKRQKFYPVIDGKNKVIGILARYNIISYTQKKLILLDHNSRSQAIDGIEDVDIIEIIDHHRIDEIKTKNPIYFRNEPVGSTATIIANIYFENNVVIEKPIAGLLCAAILSDTVIFRSPTCTLIDKIIAKQLSEIAEINIDEFAMNMFKYGSNIENKTPHEIFNQDFKDFIIGNKKVGVAQVMAVDSEKISEKEEEIFEYMKNMEKNFNYYLLMLLITDIVKGDSNCLFVGKGKKIAADAFNQELKNDKMYLKGVVSRKKQIIPNLSSILE
ncbi:MAG: putative manganese-dependent inorganic diphosphatase [Fusobacteria bacterium]|nr:putative manganese-dependent inorganic diphosphatase [Fusobacteriota bacterium]